MSIVNTTVKYTYDELKRNLLELNNKYPFLAMGSIGKSVLGKNIWAIKIGNGQRKIFYHGSIHANEWITTVLLMKFIENYSEAYVNNEEIFGYNARELYENTSLYIVPMVNPDGVDLVTGGLQDVENDYQKFKKIAQNFPGISFPDGWKANANGVDLNLQFPAEWNRAKEIKYAQGYNKPAPRDFVGYGPLTEPEALAIYNFTLYHNFELTISYHTQGEEIYWQFMNYAPPEARSIGELFAQSSGYLLTEVDYNSSFAGYKDWFIQNYRRPGYTIEAGKGVNPLPISQFNKIYNDNIGILVLGLVLQ